MRKKQGTTVFLQKLGYYGPHDKAIKFLNQRAASRFLERGEGYISAHIKANSYVLENEIDGIYYVLTVKGMDKSARDEELTQWYKKHRSELRLTDEERKQIRQKRRRLLLGIDAKYGDIANAEGSKELEEYRELIGIKEKVKNG